ncbi:MAG: pantoate--beta-alanine ligase [SAR324 cluster bacterium]|nr:pantoate--beta-alanine ligase [SAR324 cluster bacterium]
MNSQIFQSIEAFRKYRSALKGKVAVVPTMGALHEGHLSLVHQARTVADHVIMTIFVNPSQFGPHEDFNKYPRTLENDVRLGQRAGVDCFFTPEVSEIYPEGYGTWVIPETPVCQKLEGASRPGHFRGVTTVVLKLFNIIQADVAIFGRKDYQQCLIIRQMVRDLNIPIQLIEAPIHREPDGLAMSSRNRYLSTAEREYALGIQRSMKLAKSLVLEEKKYNFSEIISVLHAEILTHSSVRLDYATFVDPETLEPQSHFEGQTLFVAAVWVGKTRLIDNITIESSK